MVVMPPVVPPPRKVPHERRIVLHTAQGIPTILGLCHLVEPPLELTMKRGKKKIDCFMTGMNGRAVIYQEPL